MGNVAKRDSPFQNFDNMILPDDIFKGLRAILAIENATNFLLLFFHDTNYNELNRMIRISPHRIATVRDLVIDPRVESRELRIGRERPTPPWCHFRHRPLCPDISGT